MRRGRRLIYTADYLRLKGSLRRGPVLARLLGTQLDGGVAAADGYGLFT